MAKLNKIALEDLEKAAKAVYSATEMLKVLGLSSKSSSMITNIRKLVIAKGIDISHWTGQLWSKGKTGLEDGRIRGKPPEQIFVENSNASAKYVRSLIIRKNLLEYKCNSCQNDGSWYGKILSLQLDHINGNRTDHRLENLRWLCPNCHSQTDTYGGRNSHHSSTKKVSDDELVNALKQSKNINQALKKVGLDNGRHYKRAKNLIQKYNLPD